MKNTLREQRPYTVEFSEFEDLPDNPDGTRPGMNCAFNKEGVYIGTPEDAEMLFSKYGIVEFFPHKENGQVCCIGWNPKEEKWYGWSHRALYGFGIGSVVEKGDSHADTLPVRFEAKTLEDAKKMAIAFAESVS